MSEVLDLRQRNNSGEIYEEKVEDFYYEEEPPKKKSGLFKTIVVVVLSVSLTTIGIKASDKLFNPENSTSNDFLCSSDMVFIPNSAGGFCMDKFEASASLDCPNVNPANQEDTRTNLNNPECRPESKKGTMPWRSISQNQAAVACAKVGKRLPTSKEWLQASLGTPDKKSSWTSRDCQVANNWENQPGFTGSGENCVSSVGAYDMVGNVWEWVDETISEGKYKGIDLPDEGYVKGIDSSGLPIEVDFENPDPNYNSDYLWIKKTGTKGILKGGFWGNKYEGGIYSAYLVFAPSFAGDSVGFRCVQ